MRIKIWMTVHKPSLQRPKGVLGHLIEVAVNRFYLQYYSTVFMFGECGSPKGLPRYSLLLLGKS